MSRMTALFFQKMNVKRNTLHNVTTLLLPLLLESQAVIERCSTNKGALE